MILIGFKFHPGHQNAKYGCGDVNKKGISITDIAASISEPLACFSRVCYFFICLIFELYINACSIRILKQYIPHLLSVLIVVYVFPR
jgi:hypothetical protein